VDPDSAEAIRQALLELTADVDLRRDLARRGTARAQLFTWEKAVRETWNVYRELIG